MQLNSFLGILADAVPTAPASGGAPVSPGEAIFRQLPFFILIFVIFYFLLIRPQQKRAKEQRLMLEKLKSGDKVITSAGIIGEVVTVKERSVMLRSADAKFEVTKDSVVAITEPKSSES